MAVHGTSGRVYMQLKVGISLASNGRERMAARGANGLVDLQLKVGISLAFNGRDRTCVTGMSLLVTTLLKVGIYLAFNGQVHVQYSYFHMNLYEYVTAETPASVLPQTRMSMGLLGSEFNSGSKQSMSACCTEGTSLFG